MKYNIEAIKRKMLVKYPFFGSVVAGVNYKENKDIPTAATDGETIYYNSEYLNGLSVEEQTFIFAHEVCHIAFNHILRSEGKDPEQWNIATDAVINQFLKHDGLKMAPGGIDMPDAINYDAEKLYEKLLHEKQQNNGNESSQNQQDNSNPENHGQKSNQGNNTQKSNSNENQQNDNQQNSSNKSNPTDGSHHTEDSNNKGSTDLSQNDEKNQDIGHDTHSMWEDAVKKHKEAQSNQDKEENLLDREKNKSEKEKKQEELEKMGEKEAFKKNLQDKKKQLEELKEAISKQASQAGTSTNRDLRTVNDIGRAKPLIDWRYILREAIKYDVDWSYKNATIEDGVVLANLEEQPMPETEIVLDTSGSINEILLKNFLRECKNILQHSRLKVGCFDTEFYGFHDIRTEEDIENMRFQGCGGTNFDAAVGAFTRRVENKIIFTDGESSMPKMQVDAIWIVFGGKRINPKGGKVINITPEQLNKLYSYQQGNSYIKRLR